MRTSRAVTGVLSSMVLAATGCRPTVETSLDSPEPAARNRAILRAAQAHDHSTIPGLIRMLDSDDPLTRMLAIRALQDLTGQTLGYDYRDAPDARHRAADAWVAWYEAQTPSPGTSK